MLGKQSRRVLFRSILILASIGLIAACQTPRRGLRPQPDPVAEARALTSGGDPAKAFEEFEKLLAKDEDNLGAHRGLVEAAYFCGRLTEVEKRYSAMLSGERAGLGRYGLALVAVVRGPGGLESALRHFSEAAKLMPREADIPYRVGLLHLRNEDCGQALPALVAATQIDPRWAPPRIARAHCLEQLSRDAEAMDALRPTLDADMREADLKKARAIAERIYDLERGLPPQVKPDVHKATELLSQEAVQQALLALDDLLVRFPELSLAHTLRGLAHSRLNNSGEAIVAFAKALKLRKDNPDALVGLGDLYSRVQKWSLARENYRKAIEVNPFFLAARLRLADLAFVREDFESAARQLELVIRLEPETLEVRYRYSEVLERLGRLEESLGVLESVLQQHPEALESLIRAARLYLMLAAQGGERTAEYRGRAQECLKVAHEVAPDNQAVRELLDGIEERG